MNNKKDNNSLMMILALVCLVVSCAGSIYIDKTTTSLVTHPNVLAVTDPKEFVAIVDGEYESGKLNVKVETNAPDGSIINVYVQHPETELLEKQATVARGIAEADFEIPEGLSTAYISLNAVLDMSEQEGKSLPVARYGEYGQEMIGENVATEDGVYFLGFSNVEGTEYPSEEAVKETLREMFEETMYGLAQQNPELFYSIKPSAEGSWEETTVVLSDFMKINDGWNMFGDEEKTYIFSLFENLPIEYAVVEEDVVVKVTIVDIDGNVVDQNY